MLKKVNIHAASPSKETNTKYQIEESYSNLGYQKKKSRAFTNYQKDEIIYQQNGKCASALCKHKKLDPKKIQFEHKKPWTNKGRIVMQYGRAVCIECHSTKTMSKKTKTTKKSKIKNSTLFF
jgi:hypothetical protein